MHIGEQYNHAIRHPHVFRQPVLQPHDTIRSSLMGGVLVEIQGIFFNEF